LDKYLPGVFDSVLSTKICLYGNSPDENFIIDNLPGFESNVSIACGFSGHGFKFASVVGEILADLAIDGKTDLPIDFLNAKRFG
jgi:sarcosine oxidase